MYSLLFDKNGSSYLNGPVYVLCLIFGEIYTVQCLKSVDPNLSYISDHPIWFAWSFREHKPFDAIIVFVVPATFQGIEFYRKHLSDDICYYGSLNIMLIFSENIFDWGIVVTVLVFYLLIILLLHVHLAYDLVVKGVR